MRICRNALNGSHLRDNHLLLECLTRRLACWHASGSEFGGLPVLVALHFDVEQDQVLPQYSIQIANGRGETMTLILPGVMNAKRNAR